MVKQTPQRTPESTGQISLEENNDVKNDQTPHDTRVNQILKAMNTTVAKSSGAEEGWAQLSGPSTKIVTPDFNSHSTATTDALLSDTHPTSRLINEGNEVVASTSLTELQRFAYNKITSSLGAKGIDPNKSAYVQSVNVVDRTDYPELSPENYTLLGEIYNKAQQRIANAMANRSGDKVKPASLERNGLIYEVNPEHLVLAA